MIDKNISVRYNNEGQEITITLQTHYKDLECFKFPESCVKCPVGFSANSIQCGRNPSLTKEDFVRRPNTCRLKKIDVCESIKNLL